MAKSKKITGEEVLEKKRKAERARYQRLKNNPQRYEEQREKERRKYFKKKLEGKVKVAKDMTPRENRVARKRWRENVAAFRQRRVALNEVTNRFVRETTPPTSSDEHYTGNVNNNENLNPDRRKIVARQRAEQIRRQRNKIIMKKDKK